MIRGLIIMLGQIVAVFVIIGYSTPLLLAVLGPVLIIFIIILILYLPTSRQLRRLESVTRSPVFSYVAETIQGVEKSDWKLYEHLARMILWYYWQVCSLAAWLFRHSRLQIDSSRIRQSWWTRTTCITWHLVLRRIYVSLVAHSIELCIHNTK